MERTHPTIGHIPSDWSTVTIGELCFLTGGSVQTGPFGSDLHASDYLVEGTPVVMPVNLGKNRIIEDGIARIGLGDLLRLKQHTLQVGDIIFPRRGDVGRYAYIDDQYVGWLCGTGCLRIRFGINHAIEPRYLAYFLSLPAIQEWILSNAVGTTMPNLNTSIIKALPVALPPLPEQRAIAHTLGSLDDKIELNRRMNTTLEEIVHTLFKSWFVDFDPVRTKMEGRQPGEHDAETAVLFPDRLVESPLGWIPEGWDVKPLMEHVKAVKGLSYKGSGLADSDTGVPMHNLNSVYEGGGYKYVGMKYYSGVYQERHIAIAGDVIVTNTEQGHDLLLIGYSALIPNRYSTGLFSHHLYRVRPRDDSYITPRFIYFLLNTDFFS